MRAGRWRHRALVGLVLAVALVAAGCGDDDEGSSGAQSGGETQLQDLITPGTLTVGTEQPVTITRAPDPRTQAFLKRIIEAGRL